MREKTDVSTVEKKPSLSHADDRYRGGRDTGRHSTRRHRLLCLRQSPQQIQRQRQQL